MKGHDTRLRILKEALNAFTLHGYEGARVDKIAEAAGINKASLYFHFQSKQEIFLELFTGIVSRYESFIRDLTASCKGRDTRERLNDFCRAFLDDSFNNPDIDFWNRIYYLPPVEMKRDILNITREDKRILIEALARILEKGKSDGELTNIDCKKAATALYYPLTCIGLSKDILQRKEALDDLNTCLDHFWRSVLT